MTTALWWERSVRLGVEAGRALPPGHYYELRYERLVVDPEIECRRLCEFLGVPYDGAMLRFHEGRVRSKPELGLPSKRRWLPPTSGLRDWRAQMPPDEVGRFEVAAGDLLDELGYSRAANHLRPEQVEHASGLRHLFVDDAVARERPVPRRWAQ